MTGELKAACGSYARAFKFLCLAAGIPGISISTDVQMVGDSILLLDSLPSRTDRAPEATEFLKELLIPGSTK